MYACMLSHFSHVGLSATPQTVSPPGSSVWGILQAEFWSGLSFPTPGDLLHPGIKPKSPASPALAGGFFTTGATWETLIGICEWIRKCILFKNGVITLMMLIPV